MDRKKLLTDWLLGVSPALTTAQVDMINAALKAFSDKQLTLMDNAGVRLWPFVKGLPPEILQVTVDDLKDPAAYDHQVRVIRISPASLDRGSAVNHLRHEFAHAWDNVRTRKTVTNLRKMKMEKQGDEFNARSQETQPFGSDSTDKLPPSNRTMQEMLVSYKQNLEIDREKFNFAHESTATKHITADVNEFYAEGYSVFHGVIDDKKARMYWIARDFFDFLDKESKAQGLVSPNIQSLESSLDGLDKDWRSWRP